MKTTRGVLCAMYIENQKTLELENDFEYSNEHETYQLCSVIRPI